MDPSLISAAVRLIGRKGPWLTTVTYDTSPIALTDAGLLALTQALVKNFWCPTFDEELGWIWRSRSGYAKHQDFATAACLAAQQEVGNE